eukprot:gene13447-28507_t
MNHRLLLSSSKRLFSSTPGPTSDLEKRISDILRNALNTTKLVVLDTSGGCGAMFNITVESPLFKGLSLIKQHKMVNKIIEAEIKEMHGLTLNTKASP